MALLLSDSVLSLKGVGEKRAEILSKNGIRTIEDLLFFFPRTYRKEEVFPLSEERCGRFSGFYLTADSAPGVFMMAGGRRVLRFLASDEEGARVNILYINQPYLKNQIRKGDSSYYFGILQRKNGAYYLFSPQRKKTAPDPDRIRPIYSSLPSLSTTQTEKMISQCLVPCLSQISETLSPALCEKYGLLSRKKALFTLHCPETEAELEKAKERFCFEELFGFSIRAALFQKRYEAKKVPAFPKGDLTEFYSLLPFSLTEAQHKVLEEIRRDMTGDALLPPMNRLLQGDVGSGKTVVAAGAAYLAAQNGKSTLLMAPTEILAQQHFATFQKLFSNTSLPVFCLTGSTPKKEREELYSHTLSSLPYVLIGTHALIEESALCQNVALAITDEQHRFGVRHRTVLGEKGGAMHSLVMSATPIPRSLAMFLYAGGKISVIDKLPPGRMPVETLYVGEDKIPRIYSFLKEKIAEGRQAYVVCPLIEDEDDASPLQSVQEEFSDLRQALDGIPVALLHGQMKPAEKNRIMDSFQRGETKVLVSTTVIEVGVDVPNSTVMVIRNAERFGLSQLHQLRGRVGRGEHQSYCILISSHSGKSTRERLKKLCDCHDGFELAKYDLKTRGPGEFFGTRQSGFGGVDFSGVSMALLEKASLAANEYILTATPEELAVYQDMTKLN